MICYRIKRLNTIEASIGPVSPYLAGRMATIKASAMSNSAANDGKLILVLGDQLSLGLSVLASGDQRTDRVLMVEARDEGTYVAHHRKKIAFILSAMRHFHAQLQAAGWQVDYVTLDDPENTGSIVGEVERAKVRHSLQQAVATRPGEWRLVSALEAAGVEVFEDDRFICRHHTFDQWAEGRKQLRMEYFYRDMRRATGLLMAADGPEGGKWNFDHDNRKPPRGGLEAPAPTHFQTDAITRDVLTLVETHFPDHFGDLTPFWFAVTAADAEQSVIDFIAQRLPSFGDYQDAMQRNTPFMFHAVIGLYLNAGLLDPLKVCQQVEKAYHDGKVAINAAEGFIRQVIGWREFVRGIYWRFMPEYADRNALDHHRPLPDFYWHGETDMACMADTIGQTKREAYAHHIQRLMVTGNFAMLAAVDPRQVHEWYLAVYADAYEWVELPNTLGMSQFADGGVLASKPYAASGNYINRMSNYCRDCRYNVKQRTGPDACPFNFLYWDFLARHRDRLAVNPRVAQIYRSWDRFEADHQAEIRTQAAAFLDALTAA